MIRTLQALGCLVFAMIWAPISPAQTTVTAHIDQVLSEAGLLRLQLCDEAGYASDGEQGWCQTASVAPQRGAVSHVFNGVPPGVYIVTGFHDANADGRLDLHWYGKPKEGVLASKGARSRFGPPKFKKGAFEVGDAPVVLTLRLFNFGRKEAQRSETYRRVHAGLPIWEDWVHSTQGGAHMLLALLAIGLGPVILTQPKGDRRHRTLGRVWMGSMALVNGSALVMYDLTGGPNLFHAMALLNLFALGSAVAGLWRYRRSGRAQDLRIHVIGVLWGYYGVCAAGFAQIASRYLPELIGGPATFAVFGLLFGLSGMAMGRYVRAVALPWADAAAVPARPTSANVA
ncbi:MAG: DUF2141 domain-containing protein [Maricaulaceae bacterium]